MKKFLNLFNPIKGLLRIADFFEKRTDAMSWNVWHSTVSLFFIFTLHVTIGVVEYFVAYSLLVSSIASTVAYSLLSSIASTILFAGIWNAACTFAEFFIEKVKARRVAKEDQERMKILKKIEKKEEVYHLHRKIQNLESDILSKNSQIESLEKKLESLKKRDKGEDYMETDLLSSEGI